MTRHLPKSTQRVRLTAAGHLLVRLTQSIGGALDALDDSQPGFPSGGEGGPSSLGDHSDRTGDLAARTLDGFPDQARADLDHLDMLCRRICDDIAKASDIARRWSPPTELWRDALATEAASHLTDADAWCRSCLRVGSIQPRRSGGTGDLCRWCQDMTREIGGMPPEWLVEKRRQGGRITTIDVGRARQERKASKGKGKVKVKR